ncbi:MAG: protease complex subunit PrcB family protein [Bacteroidota bacterium]
MRYLIMICLGSLIGLSACKSQQSGSSSQPMQTTVLMKGEMCGIEKAQNLLIRDLETFQSMWETYGKNQMPAPKMPDIDFATQAIIAVFMGTQSNGGYNVSVAEVAEEGSLLKVKVTHTVPGSNCLTTMAITQPFQMVSIAKPAASEVAFEVNRVVNECK